MNISHEMRQHSFHTAKQALIDKVKNRGDLPCASIDYQLNLIQQLSEFPLGQFLIERSGTLVTSALEPALEPLGPNSRIDPKSAFLQKILFMDILDVKWQVFRSEELVRAQLSSAGFTQIDVQYDEAELFPTFSATKIQ